jgi:VWFA-related protein
MSRPAIAARLLVSCLCLAVGLVALRGQARQPAPAPQFRLGINLVQIDVTVLGPDGRPARGLAREDFTLFEDGEPQDILGFAEVYIPDATDGPAWLRDAGPDVRTAADGRVLIFLLDDATTRDDLQSRQRLDTVKRIAAEVIDRMGPTDVAAVVCTFDKVCAQDFTSDRALLKAAVSRFAPKSFNTAGVGAWRYDWYRQSAGVAASVVKYLIEQPGRRKALIYVTAAMPTRPLEWPPVVRGNNLEENVTLQQVIRTFEHAMRSKVTVYGINSAGLLALGGKDSASVIAAAGASDAAGGQRFTAPERSLALETGGFMIQGPAQFSAGVAQIFRETGSYYLLGYEQPSKKNSGYNMLGDFRSIEVRLNRPGLTVRQRAGYIAPKPAPPPNNPPPAVDEALAGILPKPDLPLRVSVAPFAVPGRSEAALAIVLGVLEPAPQERTLDRLAVQFRAFTPRGDARGLARQTMDVMIPAGRSGAVLLETLSQLPLKPGVYALRFSAGSERLGKEGSVYADVEIPDFAKAPLSLSGALLTAASQPPAAPADALASLVPVVPTTLREFDDGQRVGAFVRVYQGGKGALVPVTVTARILDEAGRLVAERVETITAAQFGAARANDFHYQLPLGRLVPGLHLLRIEAAAGALTARRDIRFTVAPFK